METKELTEMMTAIYKIMGSDDFAESVAKMLWKLYSKLKEQGFSDEQAIQMTMAFSKSHLGNEK